MSTGRMTLTGIDSQTLSVDINGGTITLNSYVRPSSAPNIPSNVSIVESISYTVYGVMIECTNKLKYAAVSLTFVAA
jgi:hypothetical protein